MPKPEEYTDAAEASEQAAEEFLRYGQKMLEMGQKLLMQAAELAALGEGAAVNMPSFVEERSVGKQGVITFGIAAGTAEKLESFTRAEFAEALGLKPGPTSKWISRLVENKPWPIIKRIGPGKYKYIGPEGKPSDPSEAPEHDSAVMRGAGVGADREAGGQVIAYTGRPMGSTGKPGLDKKLSQRRRIRRKSGQIIGR